MECFAGKYPTGFDGGLGRLFENYCGANGEYQVLVYRPLQLTQWFGVWSLYGILRRDGRDEQTPAYYTLLHV